MKNLFLFLVLCPFLIFGNDEKIPSKIKEVTVYLNGASITRTATCNLNMGATEITLTGLSTKIDESSIQISGLKAVSILSMSYDINFMPIIENTTASKLLHNRLTAIETEIALLKNNISGLQEEEQVIYANRQVSARTQGLSLERVKEISTYYRQRITAIKNEIFKANLEINLLNDESRKIQKQMGELNNTPEVEQGEIKIKFDAPIASRLELMVTYQVQDAGWIPNYDIKSNNIKTPLSLRYKAHVYQKTGNDWDNVNITLSTGNPNINVSKPNLGTKYLNFTSGYQNKNLNAIKKNRYVYNPSVRQITGTVVDESGLPLPGASIIVQGTTNGTTSDFDGHFSLDVTDGQELLVSYIGFYSTQLPIYSSVMNVRMDEDASALDEVVVVGYGSKNRRETTGAVSSVSSEELSSRRNRKNYTNSIHIRGNSTIEAKSTPMYVVDGVPVAGFEEGDLDMDEIQSVEVLKGASATAIYGTRGANGIIVITTNKSTIQDGVTNTKFVIKKPYSIASDGDITAIEINTFKLDAKYVYFAAPIINENVFLTTTFSNWEQYNLLPGEASVYFKGAYAGKTTIDPYTTKKEMTISLGIDQNITVTRKQNKNFKNKSFTGSNRILDRMYDLEVKNNKSVAIDLKLVDRIPISQQKEIKVTDIETFEADYDTKKSILTWKINLAPQATQKKSFSFKVKYPKGKRISI